MGSDIPAISDRQWNRIAPLLPEIQARPADDQRAAVSSHVRLGLRDIAQWAGSPGRSSR